GLLLRACEWVYKERAVRGQHDLWQPLLRTDRREITPPQTRKIRLLPDRACALESQGGAQGKVPYLSPPPQRHASSPSTTRFTVRGFAFRTVCPSEWHTTC